MNDILISIDKACGWLEQTLKFEGYPTEGIKEFIDNFRKDIVKHTTL